MTLILATVINNSAILAADRRTHTIENGGEGQPSDGDKLFRVAGCAVASYGESPPNFNIPDFIRTFEQAELSPQRLAETIYNRILTLEHCGNFGLLIIGYGANDIEIWEVLSQTGFNQVNLESGQLCQCGQTATFQEEPIFTDLVAAHEEFLSIFRQVASQTQNVGAPYEFSIIREGQVSEITLEN
jgi:hypothetical protein